MMLPPYVYVGNDGRCHADQVTCLHLSSLLHSTSHIQRCRSFDLTNTDGYHHETTHSSSRAIGTRYPLVGCVYLAIAWAAFLRIQRQPYSRALKREKTANLFTRYFMALGVTGVIMSDGPSKRRSEVAQT